MKKLGVIGGLGPMATAYFLQLIVEMTEAKTDQEHIEVLLHSRPQIPDRTGYILGRSKDSPLPQLAAVGKGLVEQGAEVIAIPCITAHYFQKQLEEEIGCSILHIIEETALYLTEEKIRHVGIMATDGTLASNLFQEIFAEYQISCIVPTAEEQKKVMHIIYDNIKAGRPAEMNLFYEVSDKLFQSGAETVLLGCTELSVIKRDNILRKGFLDVMDVLARRAVSLCGTLKPEYGHVITG